MSVVAAALLLGAVAVSAVASLSGLRMWLAFKSRGFEHAPLAQMQRKLDELDAKLLNLAIRR